MKKLILLIFIFQLSLLSYSQEYKKTNLGKWQTKFPAEWTVKEELSGRYNKYIINTSDDTIYCELTDDTIYLELLPLFFDCLGLMVEYDYQPSFVLLGDTAENRKEIEQAQYIINKNKEIRAINDKYKAENPDCFSTRKDTISIFGFKGYLSTPIETGKGLTGIHIFSIDYKNYINLWGRDLNSKDQKELLNSINLLERKE